MIHIYRMVAIFSVFALLGTLGALDTGTIGFGQAILQFAFSLLALRGSTHKLGRSKASPSALRFPLRQKPLVVPMPATGTPDVA